MMPRSIVAIAARHAAGVAPAASDNLSAGAAGGSEVERGFG